MSMKFKEPLLRPTLKLKIIIYYILIIGLWGVWSWKNKRAYL